MATFISVQTDPFDEVRTEARTPPQRNIRRPLRGIEVKQDTYAVLRAKKATGEDIPLFDSSSPDVEGDIGRSHIYSNFLLQSVQEQRAEKQQIVETFGEDYIFFFGEKPRFLNVTGILLNTADFNWKSEFWANYENTLRGTRMVEQNARLYLYYDDVVVEGYIISASASSTTDKPNHLPFSFQMFITNYAILSTVGSVYFQRGAEVTEEGGLVPASADAQEELARKAASEGSGGGLSGFLTAAQQGLQGVNSKFQSVLDTIKNTLYGRQLVIPDGIGTQIALAPIENRATIPNAATGQPIYTMTDEYIDGYPVIPAYDEEELKRVAGIRAVRTPDALEKRARADLEQLGIDTTRRETTYLLLGRGAFAATQYIGSFGVRQADGVLNTADGAVDALT